MRQVCFVADRGMVSKRVIDELEARKIGYTLGMRMCRVKEVSEQVLSHPGRYHKVADNLQVKEEQVGARRYIVCTNPEQAAKAAANRAAILRGAGREAQARGESPGE